MAEATTTLNMVLRQPVAEEVEAVAIMPVLAAMLDRAHITVPQAQTVVAAGLAVLEVPPDTVAATVEHKDLQAQQELTLETYRPDTAEQQVRLHKGQPLILLGLVLATVPELVQ